MPDRACQQICLQTAQQRLKPDTMKNNLLTIKTRLPLVAEGIAGYQQVLPEPLKTRYAVLLSDGSDVRIVSGVPELSANSFGFHSKAEELVLFYVIGKIAAT